MRTNWLQITGGQTDCSLAGTGQLRLAVPGRKPPPPPVRAAILEVANLQDLAELTPNLIEIAPESRRRFRGQPVVESDPGPEAGAENRRHGEITADRILGEP